jgi:hypothetical protein
LQSYFGVQGHIFLSSQHLKRYENVSRITSKTKIGEALGNNSYNINEKSDK